MGRGIDLAKILSSNPEGVQALDDMKDQLLIVLVKALGSRVTIPKLTLDNTQSDSLMMSYDPLFGTFEF